MYDKPLTEILNGTRAELENVFEQLSWGEDELKQARRRYPRSGDLLWHAFSLVQPTHDRMEIEFVYRSHCRELLGRVVNGTDTRPGTWAEVVCACSEASGLAPMTEAGYGTYARAWNAAEFPTAFPDMNDTLKHVEALHGSEIDDMVSSLRRKLAVPVRTLSEMTCMGYHHGEPVTSCTVRQRARKARVALWRSGRSTSSDGSSTGARTTGPWCSSRTGARSAPGRSSSTARSPAGRSSASSSRASTRGG